MTFFPIFFSWEMYLLEIDLVTQVQILYEAVCVSLCANAFRKGMNLLILPSVRQTGLL